MRCRTRRDGSDDLKDSNEAVTALNVDALIDELAHGSRQRSTVTHFGAGPAVGTKHGEGTRHTLPLRSDFNVEIYIHVLSLPSPQFGCGELHHIKTWFPSSPPQGNVLTTPTLRPLDRNRGRFHDETHNIQDR